MMTLRPAKERGHANHGWLDTYHTFSFADYHDPKHMAFRVLRVINDDRIAGGGAFSMHGHRDMEIISYVTEGALKHTDTLGNSAVIVPGEVQKMSAGTGIRHSEANDSTNKTTRLLQIWILPEEEGVTPSYGQKSFAKEFAHDGLVLTASREGRDNSISIHQDVDMYVGHLRNSGLEEFRLRSDRYAWVQIVNGALTLNNLNLQEGDGVAVSNESLLKMKAMPNAEFLLFDLP